MAGIDVSPIHKDIQADFRTAAGIARILPGKNVSPSTQGAAIDFWLRMLVDPSPTLDQPLAGLRSRRAPCLRAGVDLLIELTGAG